MKRAEIWMFSGLLLLVGSCAELGQPGDKVSSLSVIPFGEGVPVNGDYILQFPQGVAINTTVTFGGNLFEADNAKLLSVTLRKDIYVYKQWVSFDRKSWQRADEVVKSKLPVKLPGYDHPKPGYLQLELNEVSD